MMAIIAKPLSVSTLIKDTKHTVTSVVDSTTKAVSETATKIDTSTLSKQVYADVKQGLAGLATALKVGVEHVYEVIVRQQVVKAISDLVLVIFLIVVAFILLHYCKKLVKYCETKDNKGVEISACLLGFGSAVVYIIALVSFCCLYAEIVSGLVNPEYGALQDIINFVSNLKH